MAMDPLGRAKLLAMTALRRMWIFRARSYRRVFMAGGAMDRDAEIVLADLRNYGRANQSTFSLDPYNAARLAGRREMWLRISQHLNLDEEQVQKLVEIDDGLSD